MDKKLIWKKGPPPHVGWWNASREMNPKMWRWWDGTAWSYFVPSAAGAEYAERRVEMKATRGGILWTDHWPENARVPRVDPNKRFSDTMFNGERRPGIAEIAVRIAGEHPTWSHYKVATAAKAEWESSDDAVLARLRKQADDLIDLAKSKGYVVTIDLAPVMPPRMGHYTMQVSIRKARQ